MKIDEALKSAWSAADKALVQAVQDSDWGRASQAQGMRAGVIMVAKNLGYDVEIKQGKEKASESSNKLRGRSKANPGTKKPTN